MTCAILFISKSKSIHVEYQDGQGFLENILQYYGENKSISTENLEDLLHIVTARRPELIAVENPLVNKEVRVNRPK